MSEPQDDSIFAMAYVLITCAHGSDGALGHRERSAIIERLAACHDIASAATLETALSRAVAVYEGLDATGRLARLEAVLDVLASELPRSAAERFVTDLIRVVDADDVVLAAERDFVLGVAQKLGITVGVADGEA